MLTHIVAKSLLFNGQGKLLILVRSRDDAHRPGGPDLPGGQVDDGEEIAAGAVREILEETGIVVPGSALRLAYSLTQIGLSEKLDQDVTRVKLFFMAAIKDADIALSHEHESYEWSDIHDVRETSSYPLYHELMGHIIDNKIYEDLWSEAS